MPLPRAKRPEQLKGLFTLATKHVVDIGRVKIGVFAEQKVDQGEKSLERLVFRTLRKHAFWSAWASYVLDRLRDLEEVESAVVGSPMAYRRAWKRVIRPLGEALFCELVLFAWQRNKKERNPE